MLRDRRPTPPSFDAAFYRAANADLALLDDEAARAHYETRGRDEGRIASPLATVEALVASIDTEQPTLEFCSTYGPKLTGGHVRYVHVHEAADLHTRVAATAQEANGGAEHVQQLDGLGPVEARFANVFSSRIIDHQPDLLCHLAQVARSLEANGFYCLVVGDCRSDVQGGAAETTVTDLVDASANASQPHASARDNSREFFTWCFTPSSFSSTMTALARLDLSPFEVEAVYDTPGERGEFCAILRRARNPRPFPMRNEGPAVVMMQTADLHRYTAMLAVTGPNVIEYCRRHGFAYENFLGLKRGRWPWQASFNRIVMLKEAVDRDHEGWAVYLDADAYICNMEFDLACYLAEREHYGVIVATSTITDAPWDVNSGVVMVNCRHPSGRRLVHLWADALATLSQDALEAQLDWCHPDDQDWLQGILRDDEVVAAGLLTESVDLINSPTSSFIRQRQRTQFGSFEARLSTIAVDVTETMRAAGVTVGTTDDGREAARLLHSHTQSVRLQEAPSPAADVEAAEALIAGWRGIASGAPSARQMGLAALLESGDALRLAQELAELGRSSAAEGTLGGARQHRRAKTDRGFALTRALRTHDALLSLAELTGAILIENPDLGPWGGNDQTSAAVLFASIAAALNVDLSPPPTIGAWLGVPVGNGVILHQRMVEAIYGAWQLRDVLALLGSNGGVLELGGGVGLTAFYATRMKIKDYAIAADPIDNIVQRHVLGRDGGLSNGSISIAFCDDALSELPIEWAVERLREAMQRGAKAFLSFNHEAPPSSGATPFTAADLINAVGGWRRVKRNRHGLRPGHVEELYIPVR